MCSDVLCFLFLERVQVLDPVSGSDSCVPNNPLSYKRSLDFKYKLAAIWEIPHPTCNRNLLTPTMRPPSGFTVLLAICTQSTSLPLENSSPPSLPSYSQTQLIYPLAVLFPDPSKPSVFIISQQYYSSHHEPNSFQYSFQ
ncbi:hypothetical protein ILYODFUR_017167 [Ilyodon furcidens]|uniref:Uncharacterized protein n=1 Tax=Ilyodon furcidens TaxID=33524 RepID=A0ABV0UGR8_9TELE